MNSYQQVAVELHSRGLSTAAISEIMDCTVPDVHKMLSRARKQQEKSLKSKE